MAEPVHSCAFVIAQSAIDWRGAERIVIALGAIAIAFLGYRLYRYGVDTGYSKLDVESRFGKLALAGAGPGILFMGCAALILGVAIAMGGAKSGASPEEVQQKLRAYLEATATRSASPDEVQSLSALADLIGSIGGLPSEEIQTVTDDVDFTPRLGTSSSGEVQATPAIDAEIGSLVERVRGLERDLQFQLETLDRTYELDVARAVEGVARELRQDLYSSMMQFENRLGRLEQAAGVGVARSETELSELGNALRAEMNELVQSLIDDLAESGDLRNPTAALFEAVRWDDAARATRALSRGADPHAVDPESFLSTGSIYDALLESSQMRTLPMLLEAGIDPDGQGALRGQLLYEAILIGNTEAISALLDHGVTVTERDDGYSVTEALEEADLSDEEREAISQLLLDAESGEGD